MIRKSIFTEFAKDTSASMTVLVSILFVGMIGMAGIAVDIARYEANRAKIQTHLDNATLAAASLRQKEDPEVVLNKYLAAAGVDTTHEIVVTKKVAEITYREIAATAKTNLDTYFMSLFGVSDWDLVVKSQAIERIPMLEVSLVLDISGSMGRHGRLDNLKPAAKDFVTDLLRGNDVDNPHRVSISLVPYNMKVNAGSALFEAAGGQKAHQYSYCAEWPAHAFKERGFSADSIKHGMHMGYVNGNEYGSWGSFGHISHPYCTPAEYAQILPFSNNEQALHDQIDAMQAGGNTSIDLGVKWGAALLDPSSQGAISHLAGLWESGERQAVDPKFVGRPVSYSDEVTQKVLIVMTDGENTSEYRVKDQYRGKGLSPIYKRNHNGETQYQFGWEYPTEGWTKMSWDEMWGIMPLYSYLTRRGGNYTNYWYYDNNPTKNQRLSDICTTTKSAEEGENPVAIFSIAYSATWDGKNALKSCSSGEAYYFEAGVDSIDNVFNEIGGVIEKLKLVQ